MGFVWMMIVGLIAGALAKLVMPGRQGGGVLITMLLGMAGALIAGALGHALHWYSTEEGPGILAATVGALIVLAVYGAITRRRGLLH